MIKLSRLADYGVVLMTQLARDPGALKTAPDMALVTGLPVPTVAKILKVLTQEGLLSSHRGIKGGYALARSTADITIAEIIGALDGPIALTECTGDDGTNCEIELLCPTRVNWRRINEVVMHALNDVSLADMALPGHDFMATTLPSGGVAARRPGLEEQGHGG
jgi:FeS assembly SUF system regulator